MKDDHYIYYLFSQGNGYNYLNIYQDNITGKYSLKLNGQQKCLYNFSEKVNVQINGRIGTYKNSLKFLEEYDKEGYNEGMIWFKHDYLKVFETNPNNEILKGHDGDLLITYYKSSNKVQIEKIKVNEGAVSTNGIRVLYDFTPQEKEKIVWTVVSPVILEISSHLKT